MIDVMAGMTDRVIFISPVPFMIKQLTMDSVINELGMMVASENGFTALSKVKVVRIRLYG